MAGLFVWRSLRHPSPVVDFQALKNRTFAIATLFVFVTGFGLFGAVYVLPLFLARIAGFNALQIGEAVFSAGLAMVLSVPLIARLSRKVDPRLLIAAGLFLFAFSLWRMTPIIVRGKKHHGLRDLVRPSDAPSHLSMCHPSPCGFKAPPRICVKNNEIILYDSCGHATPQRRAEQATRIDAFTVTWKFGKNAPSGGGGFLAVLSSGTAGLSLGIGILELACVAVYVFPSTSVLGAILLTGYLGGGVATHLRVGDPLLTHTFFPIYVGVLIWGGLFVRDQQLRGLVPLRKRSDGLRVAAGVERKIPRQSPVIKTGSELVS